MKRFTLERGLCQGDPLSSFLFNVSMDVLSRMIMKAKDLGLIRGINMGNDDLRSNLNKSCLVKVGSKEPMDIEWAIIFRCTRSSLPITYLGLPLGGNSYEEAFWNLVINKVERRLALWKKGFMSKGGRLVMIKGVAKRIEKLQREFLWNDDIVKKKIHTVDWDSFCKSKRTGGLGIGRIINNGVSLLAKWFWRFRMKESPLWKKVIRAKCGLSQEAIQ
ncbi:hypothetical protein Ddye_012840 [Dipteronia dyeriana]|uniref:Reverse transcriptase domain-containing protein n=1 Tax=Dipteronia dyeriana TaxID=168575 RepID=A0AAD9X546_9ROSI|nr:hypothetical protein Ddye_012840 [Dipteronia dyeriana]